MSNSTKNTSTHTEHFLMPCMRYIARHPVLANLLLFTVITVGILSSRHLNIQSMPDFPWPVISVRVEWPGANVAKVHQSITVPIASELRSTNELKRIESFSRQGESFVLLTFKTKTDISRAFDEIRNLMAKLHMPRGSELPIITEETRQDPLLKLIMYGDTLDSLRYWANEAKRTLLSEFNMDQVNIVGLTNKYMNVNIPMLDLHRLMVPVRTLAKQLADVSEQQPIGRFETEALNMTVRSQEKPKKTGDVEEKFIFVGGHAYRVTDLANLTHNQETIEPVLYYKQKPAVLLEVERAVKNGGDSLELKDRFFQWYKSAQQSWPESIKSRLFLTEYELIQDRVQMLLGNGIWGILGIFIILILVMEWRLAVWIVVEIPAAVLGTLLVMNFADMSINFLSSFGFLIALGLIVDDTIVVSENAYTNFQRGQDPEAAVDQAMNRMFPPVLASSLTTIGAFLPILLMQSRYAIFLQDIPKVVIAVIIASLIQCFFILPKHVQKSLEQVKRQKKTNAPSWEHRIQNYWHHLQFFTLKKFLQRLANHAWVTLAVVVFSVTIPTVLLMSSYVPYNFLPYIARDHITLDVTFHPGTSKQEIKRYMIQAEKALMRANKVLSKGGDAVVETALTKHLLPAVQSTVAAVYSEGAMNHASMTVELKNPSVRTVTNQQIKDQWLLELEPSVSVEQVAIREPQSESEWHDINLIIQGNNWQTLHEAAIFAKAQLRTYKHVFNITDNSSWGGLEYEITPKPQAALLGVTKQLISSQLRDLLRGHNVVVNNISGSEKQTVRVQLDPKEVLGEISLQSLPIHVADKQLTLGDVADWQVQQNPEIFYQYNGRLAIKVMADVNEQMGSASQIRQILSQKVVPEIEKRFSVDIADHLESPDEKDTISEMLVGIAIGVVAIYFVLAWISRSYYWPLVMMMVIPVGFSGAILGHFWTQTDFSLLSMIAIFGLSGVVINISIILFHQFRSLKAEYPQRTTCELVIKAICYRFRAILLTTATTSIGLLPILLEKSQQAKWVQPFAVSIIFGLVFSTVLICVGLPAFAAIFEEKSSDLS